MSEEAVLKQYIDAVREAMRDYPEFNRLIDGEENDDRRRARAIYEALDQLNSIVPPTDFTLEECPWPTFLTDLAVVRLLKSLLHLLQRNDITIQDSGGVVAKENQVSLLPWTIEYLERSTITQLIEAKKARALQQAIAASGAYQSYYYRRKW